MAPVRLKVAPAHGKIKGKEMKKLMIIIILMFLIVPAANATTVIYRISSGEVMEIWLDNKPNGMDPGKFDIIVDPSLPDGTDFLDPNYERGVLGYTKILDGTTVRNATQAEIDTFAAAAIDDANIREANRAIDYLKNNPQFRRIMTALASILVDEFNILRAEHGLSDRTLQQLKTAIENRISKDD